MFRCIDLRHQFCSQQGRRVNGTDETGKMYVYGCLSRLVCVCLPQEEERKRQEELDRQRRERRYILPDEPTILVNPNWAAKNGKFDCSVMSLSVLLDYRLEDNKEHSFEVRVSSGLLQSRRWLRLGVYQRKHSKLF